MKRIIAFCATAVFIGGSAVAIASPASATIVEYPTTVNGLACQSIDSVAPVGTTIIYSLGEDCSTADYTISGGSPSVTVTPGSGGPLVWRQEVELAPGATCAEGWGQSWGEWANDRKGGPTCVKDEVWGQSPRVNPVISVTINTPEDFVVIDSNLQWAMGCSNNLAGDPYTVNYYGCIV